MSAETWNVILIIAVVLVGAYGAYQHYRKNKTIDLPTVVNTLEQAVPLSKEIIDVAQTAVNEIEQIRRQPGVQMTNNEAFARATDTVRRWFPAVEEVTDEQIITAVNSAILVASHLTNQLKAAKAEVVEAEMKGVPVDGETS